MHLEKPHILHHSQEQALPAFTKSEFSRFTGQSLFIKSLLRIVRHLRKTQLTNFFQMKIKAIHHVAIICSDYEASKKFYVEVLGCSIIKETFRTERNSYKLDLRVGNGDTIELFSFSDPPERVNNPEACVSDI